MTSNDNIKKYQKEKFEHYKKINDLKVSDDEAYIELKITDLSSIKNQYSTNDKIIIKDELYQTIEKLASFIPLDYPLVLEIHNKTFTSEEKILIRRLIKNHFSLETITKEMELKAIKRKSHFFLISGIIGFILLGLIYVFDPIPYLAEIVSFIASFSIWQFAELLLFEQDDLQEDIIRKTHLSKIRIVYSKEDS